MNKITLHIVSLAAVLTLGLCFVGCDKSSKGASATNAADSTKTAADTAEKIEYNGKIVYVQIDSIMSGYGLAKDLLDAVSKKSEKAQNELTAKGRSLEREVRDYQERAQKGLITRFQAQDIEAGLQKKQQAVMEYRERKMQELAEEEAVAMNRISEAIMQYMRKYNAEKKYSMIISTQGGNPVVLADPALNITDDLLKGLNDEYRLQLDTMKQAK
ncbi:OmpH family outer membrane protein [uncultured Rikenella sp.]|uniref:OmpH family outer membrane protein n=1 Tax=uncultured Rikenella sp. TaxID=368003 RepID=UPI0025D78E1C|nr:OmpH family outer membrane protein [uncultured Rikenella sp.]